VAGEKHIRIAVNAGDLTARREIRFEGNREVSRATLDTAVAAVGEAVWLEPQLLARELLGLYRELGRLAASVTVDPLGFSNAAALLTVRIDEGAPFVVSKVSIAGVRARPENDVLREFALSEGESYSAAVLERGRREVEVAYAREGYNSARASVATQIDLENGSVGVTLEVEEGPQQILDRVEIEPVPGLHPGVVTNALDLEEGTPVDMEEWFAARRRLLDTGLFRRVEIEAVNLPDLPPEGGVVPLTARVTLDRQPVWRLRYGLDVADEPAPSSEGRVFGAGLNADIQRRGVFGRAGTFGGAMRVNADQRIGRTFLTFPSFFGRPINSNLFLSRSREYFDSEDILAFITDKTAVTAEQRIRLGRAVQLSYGYQFERNHTFDPERDPDDPLGLDFTVHAARLTSTAAHDTRDDPFDATRGLFHSSTFEYAPSALGSDVRFVKYLLQQFAYVRLVRGLVSASAVRVGAGRGFGQNLIPSERFFAGGGGSVRGFAENGLGGFDSLGEPRGGQAMIVLNQEARFPIYRWLRGVAFADAGNVFARASDLSLSRLTVGAGGGLRFSTPFGLFRLDLGVPAVRREAGQGARWHVGFGQLF
jgi:outer membrane protein assembly factor BamA